MTYLHVVILCCFMLQELKSFEALLILFWGVLFCLGSERMEGVDLNIQSEGAFINKG